MDFVNKALDYWNNTLTPTQRFFIGLMVMVTTVYVVIKMMFWPVMIGLVLATAGSFGMFVFSIDTIIKMAVDNSLHFLVGPLTTVKTFFK